MRRSAKQTVLVLDDEESVGAFVRTALPEKSIRTIWRQDVEGAMDVLDDVTPDLALIDIDLRGTESGWELLKRIRAHEPSEHIPVVMMTGSADTLNRLKSLRMGADRYLIKPVRAETLRRVVHEMLAARDDVWWTLTLKADQVQRLRQLFFDTTADVPTLAIVVDELRQLVESGERLHVFCLEIDPLFRTGEHDLWESFDELRREFVRGFRVMAAPLLGNDVIVATSHVGASDFYCFARNLDSIPISQRVRDLERTARQALRSLNADPTLTEEVMIVAGGALTETQPVFAPRILYNAVREAKDNAERRETRYFHSMRERLIRAINDHAIRTVFQPVVDLTTFDIVGYEALSRGPAGTELENPEVIFGLARDFDLVWDLETLCIDNIRPWLQDVCSRGHLFFNLESQFIQQLQHRGTSVFETFFECQEHVVIEVTERSAIRDYRTFRKTLHQLKTMGFRIAIDDCGSGYATLEAIAELKPDFLKVGHSLFQGLESDPIRHRLVDLVARCGEMIGARTIAEAIETEEQLRVTRELGIAQGQGFLFAAPAPWETIRNWRS